MTTPVCIADACAQGRRPCPKPHECFAPAPAPAPAEAATSVGHDDDDDDTAHRSRRIPEGAAIVTIPMLWLVLLGVLLGVHLWRSLA